MNVMRQAGRQAERERATMLVTAVVHYVSRPPPPPPADGDDELDDE